MLLITIDEPFYIPAMIENLIKNSPSYLKYITIIIVPTKPKKFTNLKFILNLIGIWGLSQSFKIFSLIAARKFLNVFTKKKFSVKKVAKTYDIPVIKTESLKSSSLLNRLKLISPDVIVSIASSRIFGKSILSIPRIACINVHAGKLPKYRGINPSFWAMINQEKESAVTVHYMTEGIDDGPIIKQDIFNIEKIRNLNEIYLKILQVAPQTIIKSLDLLRNEKVQKISNENSVATYYSFPTKKDGERFRKLGFSFM